jgi:L-lactate dehydrogenase complex protein LldG
MAQGQLTGDREAFFSAIRRNIKTPPGGKAKYVENPMQGLFTERELTKEDRKALRERFIQEWTALGGQAFRVADRSELVQALRGVIRGLNIQRAMRWDHPELEQLYLEDIFAEANAQLVKWPLGKTHTEWIDKAAAMDVGIVWGDMALADTGTIVLPGSSQQPTTVSVLPITLIAIFTTAQLVDGLANVMRTFKKRYGTDLPTTTTFITGPSRTSDIEMDLTIGVHGSKYVYAFIMDEV